MNNEHFRPLGSTGINVFPVAFGAGPISGLMTGENFENQQATVRRALDVGVNWFDTAATYGNGHSEISLGKVLQALGAVDSVHLATKVRFAPDDFENLGKSVRSSVEQSCQRLGCRGITLLQIHNAITAQRDDEPTSITPTDILEPGGVLEVFRQLQADGLVQHLGITAIGQTEALREVVESGQFATIQVPYNLLNPSAGQECPASFTEANYGNIISQCANQRMGVFVIRVFAGGVLAGQPPSPHTYKTKFFPLDLYQRDQQRVECLQKLLPDELTPINAALRFVLSHPQVTSAIVGFGETTHVDGSISCLEEGPLPDALVAQLLTIHNQESV